MAEVDGLIGVADEEVRKFRPRIVGGVSSMLILLAVFCISIWLLDAVVYKHLGSIPYIESIQGKAGVLLPVGILFCVLGASSIAIDRLRRCPPPSWAIEDELKMFLLSESLLPEDMTLWKSYLKTGRARFDRASSCVSIWFYVRAAKATEDGFARVKDGQAFRYAQDVEIKKHVDRRGCWDGYDLRIWYRPENDVFNQLFRKVKP